MSLRLLVLRSDWIRLDSGRIFGMWAIPTSPYFRVLYEAIHVLDKRSGNETNVAYTSPMYLTGACRAWVHLPLAVSIVSAYAFRRTRCASGDQNTNHNYQLNAEQKYKGQTWLW